MGCLKDYPTPNTFLKCKNIIRPLSLTFFLGKNSTSQCPKYFKMLTGTKKYFKMLTGTETNTS